LSGWILAIDVGTTATAAARRVDGRVDTILLRGAPRMPSTVFWREGSGPTSPGRLVIGAEAEEAAGLAPWCLERTPKARLGEEFIQLGDQQIRPVELISEILKEVLDEALKLSGGEPPKEIRLTHPARWRQARLDKLIEAATLAGIDDPVLVPEPVAAAIHFASERLADGELVAVYDLGGGTLDTAVLRRKGNTFEVVGRTGGNEEIGGEDFDDDVFRYLGEQLDGEKWENIRAADERRDRTWGQASRDLRVQARTAKERLSRNPDYEFYAATPVDQELSISAAEFEDRIVASVRGTIAELERTILRARVKPEDLKAIYLAGGSSRIPLVARLIEEEIGIEPQYFDDPKAVIALGAARMESEAAERTVIVDAPLEEKTIPRPGPDQTEPSRRTPLPPPPPPPPPADPPPGGDGGDAVERKPEKKGRGKIIAGIAAAVLVLGGAGAAIALLGGGSSSSDTSAEVDPPPPPPPTPEEELKQMVAGQFRDCTEEARTDREPGAIAGLDCTPPDGFSSLIIESFDNRADLRAAIENYADGLEKGGACEAGSWDRFTTYTWPGGVEGGDLVCRVFDDGSNGTYWTDLSRLSVAYLTGEPTTTEQEALDGWYLVNQPPKDE